MLKLAEVKAANERDVAALAYRPIAVFMGGTSGVEQVHTDG